MPHRRRTLALAALTLALAACERPLSYPISPRAGPLRTRSSSAQAAWNPIPEGRAPVLPLNAPTTPAGRAPRSA